jgi:hypothetical protein
MAMSYQTTSFHRYLDVLRGIHVGSGALAEQVTVQERSLSYRFTPHFHPYAGALIQSLIRDSLSGLQSMDTTYQQNPDRSFVTLPDGTPRPELYEELFDQKIYNPSELVESPYPVKNLDFDSGGAYSVYNWELFYHVPLTVAIHLSRNHCFDEAQRWFHFVFDPTDDTDGPTPERFWKVKPFQTTAVRLIEETLINLATNTNPKLRQDTINSIEAWKDSPFRPHLIARYRQSAYMLKTVMAYLDNLIAWGDALFRHDTGESTNDAMQVYVLAANILGPRPQAVPHKGSMRPQTYASLRADLDSLGNAMRRLELDVPADIGPHPGDGFDADGYGNLRNLAGHALYFCVPRNDKLSGYWDTVADRLFKIRNSLNIHGIFRPLPLFEPPIDPAMLARAAASGVDVGAVVTGLNQPLPLVRFQVLLQKATELCQEVRSLGSGLLAAIEKEDNEALALLRARHERVIVGLAEAVRYGQWQEAIKTREGLEQSVLNAAQRYVYYERQLGREDSEITTPELEALDADGLLQKLKFRSGEPVVPLRDVEVDIAQDIEGIAGGRIASSYELQDLNLLSEAREFQDRAVMYDLLSSEMALIPEFGAQAQPAGVGTAVKFGGMFLAKMFSMTAMAERAQGDRLTYQAATTAKLGSYARREQEWTYQSNLAAGEITQTLKQLRAAQIRQAIAEREWRNHQQQVRHAEDGERFLSGEKNSGDHRKTSTKGFYAWMRREAKGLHGQCFQFAFDVARKAERALQHELGDDSLSYLQFGYLSGKEGLLAGEKLYLDIKRMEMAYHELNRREYELTKHISLLQVDPLALIRLRTTGKCTVHLPEALFDMDGPGHYFRRIKAVALSIPCVTGPYVSVNCTLTLRKSSIRKTPMLRNGTYARTGAEDDRFSDHFGSLESIVTSSAQNDAGLFDINMRDERYLPFENSGVDSEWQLELPANPSAGDPQQFDYSTISDVILHIRYTAREGGSSLRGAAIGQLNELIDLAQAAGSTRLFSVRHEFPSEWAKFKSVNLDASASTAELTLVLRQEHYPFWSQGRLEAVRRAHLLALTSKPIVQVTDGNGHEDTLSDFSLGELRGGELKKVRPLAPLGNFSFRLNDNTMKDLWLAVAWGKAEPS